MSKKINRKPEFQLLFEDNHLIAVNKPSGVLVQGDKTGDQPLSEQLKTFLVEKYHKSGDAFLGVPHRIDRPTSGLVLFAKTSKALVRLNKMFQEKQIDKTYWAITKNRPPKEQGKLKHYLLRKPEKNKSFANSEKVEGAKAAELTYVLKLSLDFYHLLEIYPKTGRHHQIRAQLAAINCPIKGDLKYGFDRSNKDASIHLHARSINFIHPVSKAKIEIVAPPPKKDPVWKAVMREIEN